MIDEPKPGRARLMMPAMPEARRAPKEAWELPLKLLVVGDFTQRPDPRPVEDRKPINVDGANFGKVMGEQKLALSFRVPNGQGGELAADLRFRGLADMRREAIAGQVSGPVDAILDDPRLCRLEARWRRLKRIVDGVDFRANVRLEILNCSKEDLQADYEDSPEIRKSGLLKILYSGEYGGPGGRPYGAVLLDEPLGAGSAELRLLRCVLQTAAPAHAPVIVRPAAELAESSALHVLRATEEGRYLGFGEPEIVGPALAASFARSGFCAGADGVEPLLWVATRVAHCLKVRHRYWMPNMKVSSESAAFHEAWLGTLDADPDDGARPFRAAHLRVTGDHGDHLAFELSLDAYGDVASPAGPVVIGGRLDKE